MSGEGTAQGENTLTLKVFLEEGSPGREVEVTADVSPDFSTNTYYELTYPSLWLYCDSAECEGFRNFDTQKDLKLDAIVKPSATSNVVFVMYRCRHCTVTRRTFALRIASKGGGAELLKVMKFGEHPPAIGPTPRALQKLLGNHWELYIQARRSEINGLGIGAFVYYRRAIEHVWGSVLDRLIEVARMDDSKDRLNLLNEAKNTREFTRSIATAKEAIPASLYVDNHNPFQALYDACGDGVHEYTDEECLDRSRVMRLVLGRFAERAHAVLSEDREFREALGSMASKTDSKKPKGSS
jgi:hypothetical protein